MLKKRKNLLIVVGIIIVIILYSYKDFMKGFEGGNSSETETESTK